MNRHSGVPPGGRRHDRHDRMFLEEIHDPYLSRRKLPEPTVCPECGAVYSGGRWRWATTALTPVEQTPCPACRRLRDKVPAGFLRLRGPFFEEHRSDILNLAHNTVAYEETQHPLKRVMGSTDEADGAVVLTFTDGHLPRGVGEAIKRAFDGDLDIRFAKESGITRVTWTR
jgi:hypothetical protein